MTACATATAQAADLQAAGRACRGCGGYGTGWDSLDHRPTSCGRCGGSGLEPTRCTEPSASTGAQCGRDATWQTADGRPLCGVHATGQRPLRALPGARARRSPGWLAGDAQAAT